MQVKPGLSESELWLCHLLWSSVVLSTPEPLCPCLQDVAMEPAEGALGAR